MITDMTTGSPSKILWKFSLPMLLSVVFQQLYNIVDSLVAGKFIGVDALASVGASYPVTMIFMAIATGSNIGASVVISQLFGGKRFSRMKTAVSTSIISAVAVSVILTIFGTIFCSPIMVLLNTPENIFSDSALYLGIYIYGLIFLFLYNICTGIFTALGDSKTPLYFLIFSSVGNIILDLVFVINFKMGVAGVAWATLIAQGVSSILAFVSLKKRLKTIPDEEEHYPIFSMEMLGRISRIAVPSILQQSFISVGNLFIQGLVNSYGSAVIAGYSAAIKLNTFAVTSFTTMSNGVSSFTAQNIGAGKLDRVNRCFKAGLIMNFCVVIPFAAVYFLLPQTMIGIFMESGQNSAAALEAGVNFLRIVSPFYLAIAVKLIADSVLRGSGAMAYFMTATFSDLILRVVLSFVFSAMLNSATGIWMSWPVGWTIASVMSVVFYLMGVWKKKAEI